MKEIKGKIHSIETFGTVDGPGIRFIVFMQGCCLKCKFCHNRDTWEINAGSEYTTQELLSKIEKYRTYIDSSGGGVTVTGGEPLLQSDFVFELFTKLKQIGIHTCLDTSGGIPLNYSIKKLLTVTDLVLLDIKHTDEEKAIELSGVTNKYTIELARFLDSNNIDYWIRHVLVPTLTDDTENLTTLNNLINSLSNVKKIEIIPYHSMGQYKWDNLGFVYPLSNIRDANDDDIKKAKEIVKLI